MWQALIPAAASIIGGLVSDRSNKRAAEATNAQYDAARQIAAISAQRSQQLMDYFKGQVPPNLINLIPQLEDAVVAGEMTPEQAQNFLIERSQAEGVTPPPELVAAQFDSLSSLQKIAKEGGLTAMDRAQLDDIRQQVAGEEKANRQAIMTNAAERGVAGSGLEMANRLISQQGAAERSAKMGTDVAALAQQRALNALAQSGQLAGQMRGQDVEEQMNKARAMDAIAQFNANVRNQTEASNVAARNAAQAANLQNRQNIINQNIAQRNQMKLMPIQLTQQQFQNQDAINKNMLASFGMGTQAQTAASAGAMDAGRLGLAQSDAITKGNQNTMNTILGGIQGAAQGGLFDFGKKPSGGIPVGGWSGTAGDSNYADNPQNIYSMAETKSEIRHVSDEEARALMDQLVPRKFRYKDPAMGEGQWTGVVIDEMGPEAKEAMVEGDTINPKKAISMALAGLASVNDRLSKLEGAK